MTQEDYSPISERMLDSVPISEIEPIAKSGVVVFSKETLSELVEPPLLEACEELYSKNINTIMSSANKHDIENGKVYIDIEFETLSPENQEIALRLGESFMMHSAAPFQCIKLTFPVSGTTTVGDIRRLAMEKVSQFKPQDKLVIDYHEQEQQRQIKQDIEELPRYIEALEEWREELRQLELNPEADQVRLTELRENIPKLEEEVRFREELRDKQKQSQ